MSSVGGSVADDYMDGGDGTDFADLGAGNDVCVNIENGPC